MHARMTQLHGWWNVVEANYSVGGVGSFEDAQRHGRRREHEAGNRGGGSMPHAHDAGGRRESERDHNPENDQAVETLK